MADRRDVGKRSLADHQSRDAAQRTAGFRPAPGIMISNRRNRGFEEKGFVIVREAIRWCRSVHGASHRRNKAEKLQSGCALLKFGAEEAA